MDRRQSHVEFGTATTVDIRRVVDKSKLWRSYEQTPVKSAIRKFCVLGAGRVRNRQITDR
jgi:hypothetical protein